MAKTTKKDEAPLQPIIVKKIKKSGDAHHGGAWKVAYADFVTAMMAFFLLLWLLNVSTDDELNAISSYFDPTHPTVSETTSGSGGVMGGTSVSRVGAMATNVQPISDPQPTGLASQSEERQKEKLDNMEEATLKQMEEQLRQQEDDEFKKAKQELEDAVKNSPELAELAKNLMVDVTPEGLRIQLVDQDGKPMFPSGSAEMYDYTRQLMKEVAKVITKMPNDISVRGHTDSHQYAPGAKYTNWELSADRANSSRRVLLADNIPMSRLANVMGKADHDHLFPDKPTDPRNRRISIILLREDVQHAIERGAFGEHPPAQQKAPSGRPQKPVGTFQKTPGSVYFP